MIAVKVLADDGWQNGEDIHPKGKIYNLNCPVESIQPFIDSGVLELVKASIEPEDPKEQTAEIVDTAVKAAMKLFNELNPPKEPVITVRERDADDPTGGFKTIPDFLHSIWKADSHNNDSLDTVKQLHKWDAKTAGHMAEGDPTQGGHLVPDEFRATILATGLESAIIRPRATIVPMGTNRIGFPALSDYDHREAGSGLFGAMKVYRPGEAAQKTASKPEWDKVELTLHKMIVLTYVSDELMEDSYVSVGPMLTDMFGRCIAWHEDNDFIHGTGANMPLGIMNAPCLITRTRVGDYLAYLDVCNMWSSLHPSLMSRSVWFINNQMLPYLFTMCLTCKDDEGSDVSCGSHAVYVPGNGASETPYGTLFGRPVIVTEHCAAAGTTGDIILGTWDQYLIGQKAGRGGPAVDSSIHLKFDYDETAFRAVMRFDGQPWWKEPLTPKHTSDGSDNTNELGPFVVLSTRS